MVRKITKYQVSIRQGLVIIIMQTNTEVAPFKFCFTFQAALMWDGRLSVIEYNLRTTQSIIRLKLSMEDISILTELE